MKTFLLNSKKLSIVIMFLFIVGLFSQKSVAQTATVTFDYTGASTTSCNGDLTYAATSGSVTVPTTGIPATATITGVTLTSTHGLAPFFGTPTSTLSYTLNTNAITPITVPGTACIIGTPISINTAFFNKTGPNTLSFSMTTGLFVAGVFKAVLTVTYCIPPGAPAVSTPVPYCQNVTAIPLTATGSGLLWYTAAVGGIGSSTAPTPVTTTVGTTSYYVSQTVGCEGPRAQIDVVVRSLPVSSVPSQTNITCNAAQDGTITVTASGGTGPYFFSDDNGSNFLPSTGPGTSTWTFTNLIPNNPYRIKVKDNTGCVSK